MVTEKWSARPYSHEELLSFDRLKRAVSSRVLDRIENTLEDAFPLSPEQIASLIEEEWQRAKEAVRSSPAAKEAFRRHMEELISGNLDDLIRADKDDLGKWGVAEKSL